MGLYCGAHNWNAVWYYLVEHNTAFLTHFMSTLVFETVKSEMCIRFPDRNVVLSVSFTDPTGESSSVAQRNSCSEETGFSRNYHARSGVNSLSLGVLSH